MVSPLSIDLRLRVAAALGEGETVRTVAKRFGVSVASAVRIGQRQRSGRGQVPGKIGGHRRQVLVGEAGDWLLTRLAKAACQSKLACTPLGPLISMRGRGR